MYEITDLDTHDFHYCTPVKTLGVGRLGRSIIVPFLMMLLIERSRVKKDKTAQLVKPVAESRTFELGPGCFQSIVLC